MSDRDPWFEAAQAMKVTLDALTDIGVVLVGHQTALEWSTFHELFIFTPTVGDPLVLGWQIIEGGSVYNTSGRTLQAGVVEEVMPYQIRGFMEMGGDQDASQEAFREIAWRVKKALDTHQSFTLTDDTVVIAFSYPASTSAIVPMVFGELDCWGCDISKSVTVSRNIGG